MSMGSDFAPPSAALLTEVVHRELTTDEERDAGALVQWACLVEPGDGIAGRLVAALGPTPAMELVRSGGRGGASIERAEISPQQWSAALARWRPRMVPGATENALRVASRARVHLLLPGDERWPSAAGDLGDNAPLTLWVRGDPAALTRQPHAVAIVGARAATGYGEHIARELAAEVAGRGVAVVSGAAYGIDGVAHRGALSAGGTTIALLAGGVERPYPTGHAELIDRIAATGAVVSEVLCGSAPTRWRFLQRNRLIAALSHATVVVEAGNRSGSLNTVNHAAQLGRALGAVPGPVTSAASAGCHRVLREQDARCITSAADVLELLGITTDPRAVADTSRTDDRTRVLDALGTRGRRSPMEVARRSGMSRGEVEAILGILALEGYVDGADGGWRRVIG